MKTNMKQLYILIFCVSFSLNAQNNTNQEMVLYSASNKNTTLFFSNPIKSGIVGSSNFTFGFSKDKHSNIGILKATPGEESNLLVITDNGNIFSFTIKYKKDIQKLNYFINDSIAIGNEEGERIIENNHPSGTGKINKGEIKETKVETNVVEAITVNNFEKDVVKDTVDVYKSLCQKEISNPIFYNRIYGTKDKVFVKLKNIVYKENDIYFTIILKNDSTLDYDINYLNFYITSRNKKRNTVTQTIPYKYKYIYNLPTRIGSFQTIEVVYVYEKFSLNENKIVLVEMTEDNGERNIKLEIPNTFVNNPNLN